MKKRMVIAGLSMMLCVLCGCLDTIPLTDKEMDVVAEYAASLLLKYDEKYDTPLYYVEEREERLTPTPTPLPDIFRPTSTPEPTRKPDGTPVTPTTAPSNPFNKVTVTPTPLPSMYNEAETGRQLTEIMAVEDISVTCEGYELLESVQSTEYFSLVAKEGRQYLLVRFLLHNNTKKDLVFDASNKELEYSVDINTGTVSRVSLSMLENDLQYMEIPVKAEKTAEAVLVFEIADTEIDTIHLIIENKSDEVVFAKLK